MCGDGTVGLWAEHTRTFVIWAQGPTPWTDTMVRLKDCDFGQITPEPNVNVNAKYLTPSPKRRL